MPKTTMMQGGLKTTAGSPQIIQTSGAKTAIPQGATIVKLVNGPPGIGGQGQKFVKSLGSNMVTLAKPGQGGAVGGKQTIVINKPGVHGMPTTLKGAGGQQIIMVSSAGGLKQMTQGQMGQMSQAGPGGVKMIVVSSSQLASTQSKPITISMPGTHKTVTLSASGKGGQIVQTSTGQYLQLPPGGLMSGGKPIQVQMAGGGHKTLTLVQAQQPATQVTTKVEATTSAAASSKFFRVSKCQ
jgi:hypothetical protein